MDLRCKRIIPGTYHVLDERGSAVAHLHKVLEGSRTTWYWSYFPGIKSDHTRGYGSAPTKREVLETIRSNNPAWEPASTVPGLCNAPLVRCTEQAVVYDAGDPSTGFVKRYCDRHAAEHQYNSRKARHPQPFFLAPEQEWKPLPDNRRTA